jgi:hypothetical protein
VSSDRFCSVLEDRKGNLRFVSVNSGVYTTTGSPFKISPPNRGWPIIELLVFTKTEPAISGSVRKEGASRYDGKSFQNYKMEDERPKNWQSSADFTKKEKLINNGVGSILEDRTEDSGLVPGATPSCMMEKHSPKSPTTANLLPTFVRSSKMKKAISGSVAMRPLALQRWCTASFGNSFVSTANAFTSFNQQFVGYIYEDKKGNIWTSSKTDRGWVLSAMRKSL